MAASLLCFEGEPAGRWRPLPLDGSFEDSAGLPEPHTLAEEIAEDLRAALEQIEGILADLRATAEVVGVEAERGVGLDAVPRECERWHRTNDSQ